MKSIRLTLIVYFLVLLSGALAAVSWSAYGTTAQSLREHQSDSQKLIEAQCAAQTEAARNELDRRILRQAQTMASMGLISVHYEALFALSSIGLAAVPQGAVDGPVGPSLWLPFSTRTIPYKDGMPYIPFLLAQGPKRDPARDVQKHFPKHTHIEKADVLVAPEDSDHPQEYFQTYGGKGQPMQRSESMRDHWFTLDKKWREPQAPLFAEKFKDAELKPGAKVRQVTLKAPVSRFGGMMLWQRWPGPPPGGGKGPKGAQPRPFDAVTPTVFIQYASDLGPLEEKIRNFQSERDTQLANLNTTIAQDLRQLRSQMLLIGLLTFGAIWLGGYGVIRLGLAPLVKMSEAVSQVSPTNFQLALDAKTLPNELRPIAERLAAVLEQLQKAFAREKQASADISHELRTPLAALMTNLELGLRKTRSVEEYRDILDECRASGQHMYQLVERLLTLARLDAGADQFRPSEVDVTEMALQCVDLMRPLARARGLTLRLNLPDPITMESDPDKLREVLTNLLHNAVEYNKLNGAIDLSIERSNGHVRLEVRDTGVGIQPDVLKHIFKRFYRADPSRHADTPHAGLGLAIVKSYVDLMGGAIRVESSEAGTAFIVELPFVASPSHDLATAVQAAPVLTRR